jgi:predicted RNA-binding Zn-ribbon protein involved in translation (DUF1610 family)
MEGKIICPVCRAENLPTGNYCLSCGILIKPTLVGIEQKCPFCQVVVLEKDYYCPNCGRKIREKPLSSGIGKQLIIYAISVFLPPLGLWPGFKYLRQNNQKLKVIGGIAILLTVISTIITAILVVNLMNQVNDQVNQQMQNLMQF